MLSSLSKPFSEAWLSTSEWWLVLFGLLVLAGVFGEWRADKGLKIRLRKKLLSIVAESENLPAPPESLWKKHKNFFGFLLVIGVMGEFACDAIVTVSSTQLQRIADRENSILQAQSRKFERDAQSFRLKADELEAKLFGVEMNIAQTSSKVATLDPTNGPVRTVQVHVFFALAKPVVATNRNVGMKCAMLQLSQTEVTAQGFVSHTPRISLMTEQFHEQTTDLGEQKFSLDFTLSPDELPLAGRVINEQGMSASEFVKSLDGFELLFFFLPTNAVIARGILDLKVNSSLDKEFEIPVQRVDDLQVYGGVLKPRTPLKIAPK